MNELVFFNDNKEAVTTSLAIAEGTQIEHASVIKLIRNNLNDFNELGRVRFEIQPFETAGGVQKREYAELNEQQATLLLTFMRNSEIVKKFKILLVKVFFQMREQLNQVAQLPNFNDPAIAARAWAEQYEKRKIAEKKNQELAPKAEGYDRVTLSEGSMNLTRTAKILDMQPKKLIEFMSQNKWIYRRAGNKNWLAYQDKIQAGYLTHKTERCDEQVLVKPKGLMRLEQLTKLH